MIVCVYSKDQQHLYISMNNGVFASSSSSKDFLFNGQVFLIERLEGITVRRKSRLWMCNDHCVCSGVSAKPTHAQGGGEGIARTQASPLRHVCTHKKRLVQILVGWKEWS